LQRATRQRWGVPTGRGLLASSQKADVAMTSGYTLATRTCLEHSTQPHRPIAAAAAAAAGAAARPASSPREEWLGHIWAVFANVGRAPGTPAVGGMIHLGKAGATEPWARPLSLCSAPYPWRLSCWAHGGAACWRPSAVHLLQTQSLPALGSTRMQQHNWQRETLQCRMPFNLSHRRWHIPLHRSQLACSQGVPGGSSPPLRDAPCLAARGGS